MRAVSLALLSALAAPAAAGGDGRDAGDGGPRVPAPAGDARPPGDTVHHPSPPRGDPPARGRPSTRGRGPAPPAARDDAPRRASTGTDAADEELLRDLQMLLLFELLRDYDLFADEGG